MKAYLARTPMGIFAFSEEGDLIACKVANSPQEGISCLHDSGPIHELSGYDVVENDESYRIFRRQFRDVIGKFMDDKSVSIFMNEFGRKYSASFLSTAVTRDKLLLQASNALEDMKKVSNVYSERLWEWFSLHYPEANRREIVDLVARHGRRENFPRFSASLGIELVEADEKMLKSYADLIRKTQDEKKKLERYIDETARELMPNTSSLIDPLLAARFLSLSGSLEKLARMPASTIQLLGAEKSLFRHLKQQGKSPKFGILFQDGRIQSAPEAKRGKIARLISSKLMVAARIDFYSKRLDEKLKADLDEELGRI